MSQEGAAPEEWASAGGWNTVTKSRNQAKDNAQKPVSSQSTTNKVRDRPREGGNQGGKENGKLGPPNEKNGPKKQQQQQQRQPEQTLRKQQAKKEGQMHPGNGSKEAVNAGKGSAGRPSTAPPGGRAAGGNHQILRKHAQPGSGAHGAEAAAKSSKPVWEDSDSAFPSLNAPSSTAPRGAWSTQKQSIKAAPVQAPVAAHAARQAGGQEEWTKVRAAGAGKGKGGAGQEGKAGGKKGGPVATSGKSATGKKGAEGGNGQEAQASARDRDAGGPRVDRPDRVENVGAVDRSGVRHGRPGDAVDQAMAALSQKRRLLTLRESSESHKEGADPAVRSVPHHEVPQMKPKSTATPAPWAAKPTAAEKERAPRKADKNATLNPNAADGQRMIVLHRKEKEGGKKKNKLSPLKKLIMKDRAQRQAAEAAKAAKEETKAAGAKEGQKAGGSEGGAGDDEPKENGADGDAGECTEDQQREEEEGQEALAEQIGELAREWMQEEGLDQSDPSHVEVLLQSLNEIDEGEGEEEGDEGEAEAGDGGDRAETGSEEGAEDTARDEAEAADEAELDQDELEDEEDQEGECPEEAGEAVQGGGQIGGVASESGSAAPWWSKVNNAPEFVPSTAFVPQVVAPQQSTIASAKAPDSSTGAQGRGGGQQAGSSWAAIAKGVAPGETGEGDEEGVGHGEGEESAEGGGKRRRRRKKKTHAEGEEVAGGAAVCAGAGGGGGGGGAQGSGQTAAGSNGGAGNGAPAQKVKGGKQGVLARDYCEQDLDDGLNRTVEDFLGKLVAFQERLKARDPLKAKTKRRISSGLREVMRSIRIKDAKVIIVAPNIEPAPSEGSLDDKVEEIISGATSAGVPLVYALSRSRLGKALGKSMRMSAAVVHNVDGVHDTYKEILEEAAKLRESFAERKKDARLAALRAGAS